MTYFAVIATRLHGDTPMPRDQLLAATSAYQSLRESVAAQHGAYAQLVSGDDEFALFHSADAAVHFALRLQQRWSADPTLPLSGLYVAAGCHFGDCQRIAPDGPWLGTPIRIARRVRDLGATNVVAVTGTVLDLLDIALYAAHELGGHAFESDIVQHRRLYGLSLAAETSPAATRTADAWFLEGAALAGSTQENTEQEAACYREALRLRPDYPEAHNNLAVLLRARGETSAAEEHYRAALKLRPGYAEAHHNYAVLLSSDERYAEAVAQFREAIRLRPEYVPALHGYANALKAEGRIAEAEDCYGKALTLAPGSTGIRNDFAILLEDLGRFDEAIQQYQKALQHDPSAACSYNYALLLESLGDLMAAEDQYRAALDLDFDHAEAHNNLAILLQQRGQMKEAERHYLEALRLRPGDHATHYNYALLLNARDGAQVAGAPLATGTVGPQAAGNLSAREVEVLHLLASGRSNQEIADELVLSIHTVERHIANIYRKIGVRRRSEATAFAIAAGLG